MISAGSSGTAVLNLLQSALIARLLGVADFGLWALLTTMFTTVVALAGFRVAEPLTRYIVEFRSRQDRDGLHQVFGAAILTELVTLSAAAALGILIAAMLGGAYMGAGVKALLIYALSLPAATLNPVLFAAARDARRVGLPTLLTLVTESLRLLLLIACAVAGIDSIESVAWIWLLTTLLQAGASTLLLRWILDEHYGIRLASLCRASMSASRLGGFWDFMRKNFAASSISAVLKNADLLILGALQTPEAVGVFRVAKSTSAILQMISTPVSSAFYQDINEFVLHGNRAGGWQLIRHAMLAIAPVILLITLFTAVFSSNIIAIIYGDAFRPAAGPLIVLLLSSAVLSMLFWAHPTLLALGQTSFYLWSLVATTIAAIPLYWLSARIGLLPFAWVVTSTWSLLLLILAFKARHALAGGASARGGAGDLT